MGTRLADCTVLNEVSDKSGYLVVARRRAGEPNLHAVRILDSR
jgi:hypothetical protein